MTNMTGSKLSIFAHPWLLDYYKIISISYLYLFTYTGVQHEFRVEGEGNGVKRQYFNYVVAVS